MSKRIPVWGTEAELDFVFLRESFKGSVPFKRRLSTQSVRDAAAFWFPSLASTFTTCSFLLFTFWTMFTCLEFERSKMEKLMCESASFKSKKPWDCYSFLTRKKIFHLCVYNYYFFLTRFLKLNSVFTERCSNVIINTQHFHALF